MLIFTSHTVSGNDSSDFPSITPGEKVIEKKIVVDVEGAVLKPGIYNLSIDSRVGDAILQAGGLASNADKYLIQKTVNLALRLSDGVKIYIPKIGETGNIASDSSGGGIININNATLDQLDSLPGIGQITAGKIISARPYTSTQELLDKKIVSSKVFEEIKDKIGVY